MRFLSTRDQFFPRDDPRAPIRKPSDATLRMDNALTATVNKYMVVILNVMLINDERASTRLQVKEMLSLGLSYTLF